MLQEFAGLTPLPPAGPDGTRSGILTKKLISLVIGGGHNSDQSQAQYLGHLGEIPIPTLQIDPLAPKVYMHHSNQKLRRE